MIETYERAEPPPVAISPEAWLRQAGVALEERPHSRMGRSAAKLEISSRPVVRIDKSLAQDEREWNLWHEIAHVVDLTRRNALGVPELHPSGARRLEAPTVGYGRKSLNMAKALWAAEDFLGALSPFTTVISLSGLPRMSVEEALLRPDVPEARKARLRMQQFRANVSHYRYRHQPVELFAEAVACAICEPARLDAGAPGLREKLQAACEGEGLPL